MSQASESAPSPAVIDLYKTAVEMADRVSARRGVSNSFFLSVQTGFVAALGIVGPGSLWPSLVLAFAGIALSATWWLQLKSYRDLNSAKFEVINKIEEQLPVKVFSDEWTILDRGRKPSRWARYAELGASERRIPFVFMALHVVLFAGNLLG